MVTMVREETVSAVSSLSRTVPRQKKKSFTYEITGININIKNDKSLPRDEIETTTRRTLYIRRINDE